MEEKAIVQLTILKKLSFFYLLKLAKQSLQIKIAINFWIKIFGTKHHQLILNLYENMYVYEREKEMYV